MLRMLIVTTLTLAALALAAPIASAEEPAPTPGISDVARPPGDTMETRVGGGAIIGGVMGALAGLPFFGVGAIPGAIIGAGLGAGIGYWTYTLSVPLYGP